MRKIIFLLIILMLLPSVLAIDIDIETEAINNVVIKGMNNPAIFKLTIENHGTTDKLEFYNLLGFQMSPTTPVLIAGNQTKVIQLIVYPREDVDYKQFYTLNYFVRGQDRTEIAKKATMKLLELKDVFEIGSENINSESETINFYIRNKEQVNFPKIDAEFKSQFFNLEKSFSLEENERKNFTTTLEKQDFKTLEAGFYTLTSTLEIGDKTADVEGIINFVEQDLIEKTESSSGFIIFKKITKIENKGNVATDIETSMKKNIVSRLFTSLSPEPDIAERKGMMVHYTWTENVAPGETLDIVVTTNWLFPFIFIALIVLIIIFLKQMGRTDILMKKEVKFLKAKGGEFALKVTIIVKAKSYVERVNLFDRLPPLVKVYHRFGREVPKKVDENTRRIDWSFEKLEEGEVRVINYIIYSKVGILGRFALPSATAIYEKDGEVKEATSNRAFFVAAPKRNEALRD
jgi:hypothetical protein